MYKKKQSESKKTTMFCVYLLIVNRSIIEKFIEMPDFRYNSKYKSYMTKNLTSWYMNYLNVLNQTLYLKNADIIFL